MEIRDWIFIIADSSTDGIHLSHLGASRMADIVSDVLRLSKIR